MGEIADWMIEQMLETDDRFLDHIFTPKPRMPSFEEWRERFVWADIEKVKHPLSTIDDRYLGNIIPFLQKRYDGMLGGDDKRRVGKILSYLRQEQRYRIKHHIITPTTPSTPVMKLKERKRDR